ncbi:hypothetical protein NPIL_516941 [Nephila pilipes]|uniref:Uncharacterized protein n=1 Tax=Nephila pilipes TaxID=299642 RepID=A0A8X6QLB8_NEPPI|nr:hypothetical protein NPIL_516941 [Nephila pilipes]
MDKLPFLLPAYILMVPGLLLLRVPCKGQQAEILLWLVFCGISRVVPQKLKAYEKFQRRRNATLPASAFGNPKRQHARFLWFAHGAVRSVRCSGIIFAAPAVLSVRYGGLRQPPPAVAIYRASLHGMAEEQGFAALVFWQNQIYLQNGNIFRGEGMELLVLRYLPPTNAT